MKERVQKILSRWGVASRRAAEQMIQESRVRVNGRVVELGDQADPDRDKLAVDGKPLTLQNCPQFLYILLNKPIGVVSTCSDPQNRRTVLELLPRPLRQGKGLHPVGRLDINSSGALLLTNDGDLTLNLTHPRYHLPKTYHVCLEGEVSSEKLQQWRQGVMLRGKKTLPAQVQILNFQNNTTKLQVTLTEGKNRQIRRVAEQLGFNVLKLHRIAIGSIQLQSSNGSLVARGEYRMLSSAEVQALKQRAEASKLKVVVSE